MYPSACGLENLASSPGSSMCDRTSIRASIPEIFLHDLVQAYRHLCNLGFANVLSHILFGRDSCFAGHDCMRFFGCAVDDLVHLSVEDLPSRQSSWQSWCFVVVDVLCLVPQ